MTDIGVTDDQRNAAVGLLFHAGFTRTGCDAVFAVIKEQGITALARLADLDPDDATIRRLPTMTVADIAVLVAETENGRWT